jgi:hypothetical protein
MAAAGLLAIVGAAVDAKDERGVSPALQLGYVCFSIALVRKMSSLSMKKVISNKGGSVTSISSYETYWYIVYRVGPEQRRASILHPIVRQDSFIPHFVHRLALIGNPHPCRSRFDK